MVHTGVSGADRLCFAFLKQMPSKCLYNNNNYNLFKDLIGGSNESKDIWLAENLLHLLLDNRYIIIVVVVVIVVVVIICINIECGWNPILIL